MSRSSSIYIIATNQVSYELSCEKPECIKLLYLHFPYWQLSFESVVSYIKLTGILPAKQCIEFQPGIGLFSCKVI
jgi:hypothetical protein